MITAQVSSATVRAGHGACLAWRVVLGAPPLVAFNHLLSKTFTAVDNNKSSEGDKFPGLGQTLKFNLMATK